MNLKHSFLPNTEVPNTKELKAIIAAQLKLFQEKTNQEINYAPDTQYAIISNKFINQWKRFTEEVLQSGKAFVKVPSLLNQDIKDDQEMAGSQCSLNQQLEEGSDFQVYPQEIGRMFTRYPGSVAFRKICLVNNQKKLQLYPTIIRIFLINSDIVSQAGQNLYYTLYPKKVFAFKQENGINILNRFLNLAQQLGFQKVTEGRVWICSESFNLDTYGDIMHNSSVKNAGRMNPPGILFKQSQRSKQCLDEDSILAIQLKTDRWVYGQQQVHSQKMEIEQQRKQMQIEVPKSMASAVPKQIQKQQFSLAICPLCKKSANLNFKCDCRADKYCSQECLKVGFKHMYRCVFHLVQGASSKDQVAFNKEIGAAPQNTKQSFNNSSQMNKNGNIKEIKNDFNNKNISNLNDIPKDFFLSDDNNYQSNNKNNYSQPANMYGPAMPAAGIGKDNNQMEVQQVAQQLGQIAFKFNEKSRRGVTGLQNLGNTCYMNSALQCISHTYELTQYFIEKIYEKQINLLNPLGSDGLIVRHYANFIKNVWAESKQVYAPKSLKAVISHHNPMFAGYQQHDSQQFLSTLIDSIHEDLNRIKQKPYIQKKSEDHSKIKDEIVAKDQWQSHLMRNQSIITDLAVGQMKSKISCPYCNYSSLTFEAFTALPIPIPFKQNRQLNIYFFFNNYRRETIKIFMKATSNTVDQVYDKISNFIQIPKDRFRLFILGFQGKTREVTSQDTVTKLINLKNLNDNAEERQLFAIEYGQNQLTQKQSKFLIFKFLNLDGSPSTFKRPFPFSITNQLTGAHIYERIIKFLCIVMNENPQFTHNTHKVAEFQQKLRASIMQKKQFVIFMKWKMGKVKNDNIQYLEQEELTYQTKIYDRICFNADQIEFQVRFDKNLTGKNAGYFKKVPLNAYQKHTQSYKQNSKSKHSDGHFKLQQCFQLFSKSQFLEEGNEWFCSRCKAHQIAQKQMQIYKAPRYFIIQLKRFKDTLHGKQKNQAVIDFPLQMDFGSYLQNRQLPQAYFSQEMLSEVYIRPPYWKSNQVVNTSQKCVYELYATINHSGSLYGGHYTSHAKNGQKWFRFNDSSVTQIKQSEVQQNSAYILFYKRTSL